MASQKGFMYEANAFRELKKRNIAFGTGPAGSTSDKPDLEIKKANDKNGSTATGVELKISPTAAGSLVMKYYNDSWDYGEVGLDDEKIFLYSLGEEYKLLQNMNKSGSYGKDWRGKEPHLQNDERGKKIIVNAKDKRDAYAKDIEQFGGQNEIKIPIKAKSISDYYNTKKTYYMNVGTHGFYLLNKKDPMQFNKSLSTKIPDFGDSAAATIRVRAQYKGGGDYQFVMTLEFKSVSKSPYNIAPISSNKGVSINVSDLKNPNNSNLFEFLKS